MQLMCLDDFLFLVHSDFYAVCLLLKKHNQVFLRLRFICGSSIQDIDSHQQRALLYSECEVKVASQALRFS